MLKMVFCGNANSFTALVLVLILWATWGSAKGDRSGEFIRSEEEVKWLFEEWQVKHDKSYQDLGEKQKRLEIFKNNLQYIDQHNRPEHNHSFTVGLNNLADLTNEEYRSIYLSPILNMSRLFHNLTPDLDLPTEVDQPQEEYPVDFRHSGLVGPVKNQGACASGWAFAVVATVEWIHSIHKASLISLSEQELVDCEGDLCHSTWIMLGYDYILKNKGIDTEANYPYTAEPGVCKADRNREVTIDGYKHVTRNSERLLMKRVQRQPVAAHLDAGGLDFQFYVGGIYRGGCTGKENHSVTIVGYDSEAGEDYWIIRNSYGDRWGEGGYMKLPRNVQERRGKCGIAARPMYPIKRWYRPSS